MKRNTQTGQYSNSAKYVDKLCENCGIAFQVKENDLKYGRGKCCSRKCVDENKKKTYLGENNPMFGKEISEVSNQLRSQSMKRIWETDEHRNKVKNAMSIWYKRAATDGTWIRANDKREHTCLKKIGKKHNWNGKYGDRQCDIVCIEKYGKLSHELRDESRVSKYSDTSIEIKVAELLTTHNIEYIKQYPMHGFHYDFLLVDFDILIECDGDYWHGFGVLTENLDEPQLQTRKYDKLKNERAIQYDYRLLRFWEHEIHNENFEKILLSEIWQK